MASVELSDFLRTLVGVIEPLSREVSLAYWNAAISGSKSDYERFTEEQLRLQKVYSSAADFEKIRKWRDNPRVTDPLERRQIEVLYNDFLRNQIDPALNEAITRLSARIENQFNVYRATLDGRNVTTNDISGILRDSRDVGLRRKAWGAGKEVAAVVRDDLLKLVRMRNEAAQSIGYENFYAMSIDLDEQNESGLLALFEELETLTRVPFASLKEEMDDRVARRYGITSADLEPWHYDDLFFQEAPRVYDIDLDGLYRDRDVVGIVRRYYNGLGLEVDDILARSDLYEKPGKDQHAFCIDIDRKGDIRVLANVKNDEKWTGTLLHEFGHAVYDRHIDPTLPFPLRHHAHIFVTEAIAMMFGRLSKNPWWIQEAAGVPESATARSAGELLKHQRLAQLVFTRWAQVMIHFERALYRDPDQDLNALWWDLVERFQCVRRPGGRDFPDWAAKSHVVSAPVYYHNYLLGELLASQISHCIRTHISASNGEARTHFSDPAAGRYLKETMFEPGARYRWNKLVEKATGEPLTPKHFVGEFTNG